MFRREPAGKNHIRVCRTLSCALAGAENLKAKLCEATGIQCKGHHGGFEHKPDVSPDGQFSIESVECLASCGTAPVMMVGEKFYEGVSHKKADEIVAECK